MDDARLNWHLDDVSLGGFMANYAPVQTHLRKRRGVIAGNVGLDVEDVVSELEHGVTDDGVDEALDAENIVASDSEDNVPLNKRKRDVMAGSSVVAPKNVRRRLVKKYTDTNAGDVSRNTLETSALNVPVSVFKAFIPTHICHSLSIFLFVLLDVFPCLAFALLSFISHVRLPSDFCRLGRFQPMFLSWGAPLVISPATSSWGFLVMWIQPKIFLL